MMYLERSEMISSEYLIMYNVVLKYIVEYVIDVLVSYTINYKFDIDKYFNDVYLMNIDTWGVLSLYYDIVEKKKETFSLSDKDYKMLVNKIMYLMIDNVFKNGNTCCKSVVFESNVGVNTASIITIPIIPINKAAIPINTDLIAFCASSIFVLS